MNIASSIAGVKKTLQSHTVGAWTPKDRGDVSQWLVQKAKEARQPPSGNILDKLPSLSLTIASFQERVVKDPELLQLANAMFTESSNKYPKDPAGNAAIQSFDEFLLVLGHILRTGPEFPAFGDDSGYSSGLIGFPFNAILDWPMATPSGYAFFLKEEVNEGLRDVLSRWGEFLSSSASKDSLKGWLSPPARQLMATSANVPGKTDLTFEELFVCPNTSDSDTYGFESWDEFFTRQFREGVRPVAAPDDGPPDPLFPDTDPSLVIVNACESAPLRLRTDVRLLDSFYLKGQPYSLGNMLNCDPRAPQFAGGTVYQAFLSGTSYHRWHAPVSGKVVGVERVPGTYFSQCWYEAGDGDGAGDPAAPDRSQPYLSAVATRIIVYIEADNTKIGLMAVVFIGMAEVSSCEATVEEGWKVAKGEEIGMFHYGGSSCCMVFRPEVNLKLNSRVTFDKAPEKTLAVRSALAVVA